MSDIGRLVFEDDSGNAYTMYIEAPEPLEIPDAPPSNAPISDSDDEYDESMGISDEVKAKLKDIHGTIQAYTYYALGAFRKVAFADVEEMTLKFGIKIAGSTGVPILTQGSAEGSFQIEVKCKFKD